MTILTINNEQYRIRRLDQRNLVIERLRKAKEAEKEASGWDIISYYGNFEDLAHGLLKLAVNLPGEAKSLSEFVDLLRQETRKAQLCIVSQFQSRGDACTASEGQSNGDLQPAIKAQL